MKQGLLTRRNMLKGAAALAAAAGTSGIADAAVAQDAKKDTPAAGPEPGESTRTQRLIWWRAARFGMFIHFGVYSTIGRHEWVMEDEAIPSSCGLATRLGPIGQAGGHEIHGADHQAS